MKGIVTLRNFLMSRTDATELCVVRSAGYTIFTVWIDYEDLFVLPEKYRDSKVVGDEWGELPLVNQKGETMRVPCHYVDIDV